MTNDLPFLNIQIAPSPSGAVEQSDAAQTSCPDEGPAAQKFCATTDLEENYMIAVKGVQKKFSHLSEEEIFYPPHALFDAALARQIALHVMHYELSVPKRRLSQQLQRSREALERGLKTVNARKKRPEFEKTYRLIADDVLEAISNSRGSKK